MTIASYIPSRVSTSPAQLSTLTARLTSELLTAHFPISAERDPEGQQDQSHVQPKRLPTHVDEVIAKFPSTADVAWRVYLRDARQSRTYAGSLAESRDVLQLLDHSASAHFDFARPQRTRAGEAHVAAEDVPQLRQFVHRGCPKKAPDSRHPRVVLNRLNRADLRLGVRDHRAEFVHVERHAIASRPLLAIEHRTAILEFDQRGDDRPQRSRCHEADARERDVQRAFGQHADTAGERSR